MSNENTTRGEELAWAAGFFDGEGSVYVRHTRRHKGGTTGKDYPLTTVEMSVSQVRIEPLKRFHECLGVGTLRGPYKQRNNHSPYYRWQTAGRPSVRKVLCFLWEYLCLPKQQQARQCWKELEKLKGPKSPKPVPLPNIYE